MTSERSLGTHRFCLPPGTVVEEWLVVGCHGHGAYGIVYRAVRVGEEAAGEVALKVALYPWDPRFMREVALLSLIHHPSVPRLRGQGFWKHPSGTVHPFIVMEWVEGTPLYEWAREQLPTSQQVCQVLAHLARALQATHEASAVHRDVKGENVLVRSSDGRAVLTDFGAGHYSNAARLTWQSMPPGTPAYQSPEARLFQLLSIRSPGAHYVGRPADDVFALGVTAYRLVTGGYPPSPEPQVDGQGWHMVPLYLPPPHVLNPQVEPQLGGLILRMLSLAPEARGTAGELAEALEAAAGGTEPEVEVHAGGPVLAVRARPQVRGLSWRAGLVLAGVGVFLAFGIGLAVSVLSQEAAWKERVAWGSERAAEGPAGLGGSVSEAPLASVQEPSEQEAIGQELPPKPRPGQIRPDARGQCPGRKQVPINGGCWVELSGPDAEECEQNGYVLIKGQCYAPALETRRKPPPTSEPPH
jgi:hypothetical protein